MILNFNNPSRKKFTQIYIFFNDINSYDSLLVKITSREHSGTETFQPFVYFFITSLIHLYFTFHLNELKTLHVYDVTFLSYFICV